ncbi:MAG: Bona fide RidA/YjgF/TdcF/RutC subgroup [Myxococcales bacterium]|nr:Bona fide RidA/YjgF/TdcF/RutC subgroup [Myxococcales bacterium]
MSGERKPVPINPRDLAQPRGYSNGMLAGPGRMLAIAGQIGWNAESKLVSDDFVAQFDQALRNVAAVLREAGGVPTDLIMLRIYLTDKKLYTARLKEIGRSYREHMASHYPAMALLQVADLLEPGALVEIEGLAVIP